MLKKKVFTISFPRDPRRRRLSLSRPNSLSHCFRPSQAVVAAAVASAPSFFFSAAAAASAGDAVRTSTLLFVIKSVCSHCAERLPSRVTTVQPSAHISDFGDLR